MPTARSKGKDSTAYDVIIGGAGVLGRHQCAYTRPMNGQHDGSAKIVTLVDVHSSTVSHKVDPQHPYVPV